MTPVVLYGHRSTECPHLQGLTHSFMFYAHDLLLMLKLTEIAGAYIGTSRALSSEPRYQKSATNKSFNMFAYNAS